MATGVAARVSVEIGAAFASSFRTVLGGANAELTRLGSSVAQTSARLDRIGAFRKLTEDTKAAGYAWQAAKIKAEQLAAALAATENPTKRQAAELRKAQTAAERAGQAFATKREKLAALRVELDRAGVSTKNLTADEQRLARQLATTQQRLDRVTRAQAGMAQARQKMASAGIQLGIVMAAGATAMMPVEQAAAFETAMLGVAKQVEGARDDGGRLTNVYHDMARQIQVLGREIPLTTNSLAEMVAAGARMGVPREHLMQFTRTAAMMAEAFEQPAAELADKMGKIATLFKIPIPAIGGLADAINWLDDNAISKGGDIIDFLARTGGVASSVKVTGQEMAALGSTLLTLGERAETAGTATNAMFQKLAAADKGTKKFKASLAELGLSAEKVQKGMQIDSQGTIMQVMEAVNKLDPEKRLGVLVEMFGLEHSDTIAKLATNMAEWRRQIDLVNSDKSKGSMLREFEARLQTTNAQWALAKNRMTEVWTNLGAVMLPAINVGLGGLSSFTSGVADFVRDNKELVGNIVAVMGTLGAVFAGTKAWALGVAAVTWAIKALSVAVVTNPIGLALTALAVAGVLLWQNWEGVKGGLTIIWQQLQEAGTSAMAAIGGAMESGFAVVAGAIRSVIGAGESVVRWFAEGRIGQSVAALFDTGVRLGQEWERTGSLLTATWNLLAAGAASVFGGMRETIGGAMDWVAAKSGEAGDVMTAGWRLAAGALSALWTGIRDAAVAAFDGIKAAVGGVIDWLAEKTAWIFQTVDKLGTAAAAVRGSIGGAWDGAKGWVTGAAPAVAPAAAAAPVGPLKPGAAPAAPAATAPVGAVPAARASGPVVNQTNQPTYNITVQGNATDPQATARAIRAEMDRREREQASARRGALVDAIGY